MTRKLDVQEFFSSNKSNNHSSNTTHNVATAKTEDHTALLKTKGAPTLWELTIRFVTLRLMTNKLLPQPGPTKQQNWKMVMEDVLI